MLLQDKEPYKINSGSISEVKLPVVYRAHHNARILCVMEHPTLKVRLNASLLLDVQCKFPTHCPIKGQPSFLPAGPAFNPGHPVPVPRNMNPLPSAKPNRLPPKESKSQASSSSSHSAKRNVVSSSYPDTPSFAISRTPGFGYPLREGIEVSLKCDVDSNPSSTPIWQKDDGDPPVRNTPTSLLIAAF